ncbi:MAG: hypothetical protein J7M14_07010 [Planctomycetes bacterium]|nr:hypothetical protein [Planctomycetota bacterium]
MIVEMLKTYVVARRDRRDDLLGALRELGVVHLTPVDPQAAVAEESTTVAIDRFDRAIQVLSGVTPAGEAPDITDAEEFSIEQAVEETLDIQRSAVEKRSRLAELHRRNEQLAIWGDVSLEQFAQLKAAGIDITFLKVSREALGEIKAELVHVIAKLPGNILLAAVIDRHGGAGWPDSSEIVELPKQDRPSIRAEAAEIDAQLVRGAARLAELAHLVNEMRRKRSDLARQAEYTIAERSGLAGEDLFGTQGWVPVDKPPLLEAGLAKASIDAAVHSSAPAEDETPPTLISYPRWVKPIKSLFDILGTLPGYRELDLSPFFAIALPLFAAILIGDAGYGLVFLLPGVLMHRKIAAKISRPGADLLIIVGAATLVWGVLSANYFGVTPDKLLALGGTWAAIGGFLRTTGPLWNADANAARQLVIKISFIIGCVHLTLAHVRVMVAYWPGLKALAELGWCMVLWAMLGIIWLLFFKSAAVSTNVLIGVLAGGATLAVLFSHPSRNPFKRIGVGLASAILPLLGAFSDTMSYIRLMAVGLASYYIASAFNSLGATVAESATWFVAAPVVLFGHALNIALAIIAIFAHGVRLNMLEFSNSAGVQWAGYKYHPFAKQESQ